MIKKLIIHCIKKYIEKGSILYRPSPANPNDEQTTRTSPSFQLTLETADQSIPLRQASTRPCLLFEPFTSCIEPIVQFLEALS